MTTIIDAPQRSEAWFSARRGLPTCSRFDMILTPARGEPSKSQETLINQLIAESILPPEEGFIRGTISGDMEQGIKLEAEARCRYDLEFATAPVTEVGFLLAECGLYGGSPDALVGEDGGVEIKAPAAATHVGYVRAGVVPAEYRCQVHGYLVVTGRAWWDFFSYFRDMPPVRVRVYRDEFTTKLEAELLSFCARYNKAREDFGLPRIAKEPKP